MIIDTLLSALVSNIHSIELFSRAGGGGSSSSSNGGGGELLILVGYIPMHILGSMLRKNKPTLTSSIIGWSLAFLYAFLWIAITNVYGVFIGIAGLFGIGAGLYNWFDKIAKLSGIAKKKQVLALQTDSAWDINLLNNTVTDIFNRFQTDWSNNDAAAMQSYLTPGYLYHNQLMIFALQQLGRRNIMASPTITSLNLVDLNDATDNSQDKFVMHISAVAVDNLYDTKTNALLFSTQNAFQEYWNFVRTIDSRWILAGIDQETEDASNKNSVLSDFAKAHNYCYSADWGWLLLPTRGQLFKGGKFGTSDINNHVIGVYNNTLIQLYNYNITPADTNSTQYIIAQVTLPKSYGNIVVRKKRKIQFFGIKGLTRITLEWGDFNKKYEVWASDMERVTSFELLNPSFMVKLQELPFEVNIEVVDNIVYLYSAKAKATPQNYEIMLTILYQAFKEMRM